MNKSDLLNLEILPLSKVKATLSEQVKKTQRGGKRVAITANGFPRAILLSYQDFLELLGKSAPSSSETSLITYEDWKTGEPARLKVRDSILGLFDPKELSRKGQKAYKKEIVDELDRDIKKRPARKR